MDRLVRITGSGFVKMGAIADGHPVEFRHWQEVVDEFDRDLESAVVSEDEQAVVSLWLEDPMSFQTEESVSMVRTGGLRRADNFVRGSKQAAARESNWDQEFADAQAHAASVMKNLGNVR